MKNRDSSHCIKCGKCLSKVEIKNGKKKCEKCTGKAAQKVRNILKKTLCSVGPILSVFIIFRRKNK